MSEFCETCGLHRDDHWAMSHPFVARVLDSVEDEGLAGGVLSSDSPRRARPSTPQEPQ